MQNEGEREAKKRYIKIKVIAIWLMDTNNNENNATIIE